MKIRAINILFAALLLPIISCMNQSGDTITLVNNSEAAAEIIVNPTLGAADKFAVEELNLYIKKITGAELPVNFQKTNNYTNHIFIGNTNEAKEKGLLKEAAQLKNNGFIIKSIGSSLFIVGADSLGALYGVYELLERIGVRWFMPGPLGEVVPEMTGIIINKINAKEEPDFTFRWIGQNDWSRRNKCNINIQAGDKMIGIKIWHTFHSFYDLVNPNEYFDEHPEYFSYYNGRRHKYNPDLGPVVGLDWNNQICTSNPDVIKLTAENIRKLLKEDPAIKVVTLGPNDGRGFCQDESCLALDEPDAAPDQKYSRRLLIFYNQVAKIIQKTNPDVILKFGAYFIYTRPPMDTTIKALDNMAVMITHYNEYCLAHPINDPNCAPNGKFRSLLKAWDKVVKKKFIYEYYYKVNWLELPWSIVHSIREDIPYFKSIGVEGLYTQYSENNAFTLLLNYYVASKLLWNVSLNVDSLLTDFYSKFYGNAAEPMRDYYETLEAALGNAGIDVPGYARDKAYKIFTDSVLFRCAEDIRQALDLSRDELTTERIKLAQISLNYTKRTVHFLQLADNAVNASDLEQALSAGKDIVRYVMNNKNKYNRVLELNSLIGVNAPYFFGAVIKNLEKKLSEMKSN